MLLRGHAIPGALRLNPHALRRQQPIVAGRSVACFSTEAGEQPGGGDSGKMEKSKEQHPSKHTGDVMSNSFGEGYSTRSDEEGFGGIYGGNQSLPKDGNSDEVHINHPEYDKSQGSEVAQKEEGRNQPPPAAK